MDLPSKPFTAADPMMFREMPVGDAVQVAGLIELYAQEAQEEAEGAIRALLPSMVGTPEPAWREAITSVYDDVRQRYTQRVAELFATS